MCYFAEHLCEFGDFVKELARWDALVVFECEHSKCVVLSCRLVCIINGFFSRLININVGGIVQAYIHN